MGRLSSSASPPPPPPCHRLLPTTTSPPPPLHFSPPLPSVWSPSAVEPRRSSGAAPEKWSGGSAAAPSSRAPNRSWRWEQEAEGVLCDPATRTEVSSWCPGSREADPRSGMRRLYGGPGRAFSKLRGLVVAGDELPEEVTWRVGRAAERSLHAVILHASSVTGTEHSRSCSPTGS